MKIVAISDTHGRHDQMEPLPEGDVLVHTGDVSGRGRRNQVIKFLDWFKGLNFEHKIFIAGNHDFYFEQAPAPEIAELVGTDLVYLNDSGLTINGINFWGSPVQPWFYDWAFNRQRGADIDKHWQLIPANTDVLLTHGPPKNILDKVFRGENVGCEMLLKKIREIKPKVSIFGHIHEAYGTEEIDGTKFINASIVNLAYEVANKPVVFEV